MDRWKERATEKKRQKDLEFLTQVRTASLEELTTLAARFQHKNAPAWKKAAIHRAFHKALAKDDSNGRE